MSNDEMWFVSWGIEEWHTQKKTVIKEIQEETGLTVLDSIVYRSERNFDVQFYSPHRDKNYHNITHVYRVETNQTDLYISDAEKNIQSHHRWTLDEIQDKIHKWRDNTNYEATQYIVDCIKKYSSLD